MEIIPAIDILGGRCVRLAQGDYSRETVFGEDPIAMAVRWASQGADRIHVVDLDGARTGERTNAAVVSQIVDSVNCAVQTSGGIRSVEMVREMLDEGVNRVVIGTGAVKDPEFLRESIAVARDRLIVSVDAREERSACRAGPRPPISTRCSSSSASPRRASRASSTRTSSVTASRTARTSRCTSA